MRFTQYYAASPICSPSRCGLITGQYPARWRITSYLQTKAGNKGCEQADYLDPQAPSLPRALQRAGYKTAHFGKWHLGGGRDVEQPPKFAAYGYDEHAGTWESPEPHPDITAANWIWSDKDKVKRWERTAFFVDRTLDFLKRHQDSPCFVNVWLDDPHTPWVPNAEAGKGASTPENLKAVLVENDRQIGRLLDGLKDLGLDKNTLVIFTSDNGPLPTLKGDRLRGLRGSKLSLYEGGIRVPFLARWPGVIPAGRKDETTVIAAVDLFPTFCRLAGAELPKDMKPDGEDRSVALLGQPIKGRAAPLFGNTGGTTSSSPIRRSAPTAHQTWRCATAPGSCWSTPTAAGWSCTTSRPIPRKPGTSRPTGRISPNDSRGPLWAGGSRCPDRPTSGGRGAVVLLWIRAPSHPRFSVALP